MMEDKPVFKLRIYSRATFDTEERAREMVDYLLAQPRFAPNKAGEYEPYRRLTPKRVEEAITSLAAIAKQEIYPDGTYAMLDFIRSRNPACSFFVEWSNLPHTAFSLSSYIIDDRFVRKAEQLEEWMEFAAGLLDRHEAWYARFTLDEESNAKNYLDWSTTGGHAPSRSTGSMAEWAASG